MFATETTLYKKLLLPLFARYTKRSILIWDGGSKSLDRTCTTAINLSIKDYLNYLHVHYQNVRRTVLMGIHFTRNKFQQHIFRDSDRVGDLPPGYVVFAEAGLL